MKKTLLIFALILIISGCTPKPTTNQQLTVMTSLFPQFDFAREIAKDRVQVDLLLPPGVEPHAFDPTPSQMVAINKADLFIFTNHEMEPWVARITQNIGDEGPTLLESSDGIAFIMDADHDHGYDPHVWLDPRNAKIMVQNITDALSELDPENQSFYQENARVYLKQLDALDATFDAIFEQAQLDTIIYGGHFAFGYLMDRFNITILSPYVGFAPDAEPTAKAIAQLVNTIEAKAIDIIFFEELIEPRIANIISEQTNTKAMLLHGAHNITKAEMEAGVSYLSIMNDNAIKLKEALHSD